MSSDWLNRTRADLAAEQILDAAAQVFIERGVANTGMGEVARAAGCSRATLYRYYPNRHALRMAFIHREALRVGAAVVAEVHHITDPGERVVAAMQSALRIVRTDPTLIAWFGADDAGLTGTLGHSSDVIEAIAAGMIPKTFSDNNERSRLARWLARMVMSLLTAPGRDTADERVMLEQFVAPLIVVSERRE